MASRVWTRTLNAACIHEVVRANMSALNHHNSIPTADISIGFCYRWNTKCDYPLCSGVFTDRINCHIRSLVWIFLIFAFRKSIRLSELSNTVLYLLLTLLSWSFSITGSDPKSLIEVGVFVHMLWPTALQALYWSSMFAIYWCKWSNYAY